MMIYRTLTLFALLFSIHFSAKAQDEWIVPDENKTKLSPFEFSADAVVKGNEIYSTNCASCHGEPGKNNFVQLVPPPGDPGAIDFQANNDGEFYYKIREGKGTMPSFKNTLTPDDVWTVISYIRSFNSNYVQEVAKEIQRGAYDGVVSINLAGLDQHKVKATVTGNNNNTTEPIEGAAIRLVVERLFGNLQVDEEKITNKNGEVIFSLNNKIPGDSAGNLQLIAQLTDQEAFGVIESEILLPLGKPIDAPSLVAERAIWNKMTKAPIWLLMAYSIAVLAAWGTIFYIMLQLRQIFLIGKE